MKREMNSPSQSRPNLVDAHGGPARVDATVRVREPWRKPTIYLLSDLDRTSGSPTNKGGPPLALEDETRPPSQGTTGKLYRPITP